MSAIKPEVAGSVIRDVLRASLGAVPFQATPLEGGNVAQAYSVETDAGHFILRFNHDTMDATFAKEAFIAATFGCADIPIPEVLAHGKSSGLDYCLTRRVEGRRLDLASPQEVIDLLPALARTLVAMHASDVSRFPGAGLMDDRGHGLQADWPTWLLQVRDEERDDGFFGKWHRLFDTTFLRRDVFDEVFARMADLLPYLPVERQLVHGNFGFGNVLVLGNAVTAVIDWFEAGYGDFAYDVAWLDFWDTQTEFGRRLREVYLAAGADVDHWQERLRCYQCRIALDAMRFFAKADNEPAYGFTTGRIGELLGGAG